MRPQVARHLRLPEALLASLEIPPYLRELGPRGAQDLHRGMDPAFDILGEEGDAQAPPPDDLAAVGLLQAGQQAQQRGLASPVAADEPDPGAG